MTTQTIEIPTIIHVAELDSPSLLVEYLNLPSVRRGAEPSCDEVRPAWPEAGSGALSGLGDLGRAVRRSLRGDAGGSLQDELNRTMAACPVVHALDGEGRLTIAPTHDADAWCAPALKLALTCARLIAAGRWARIKQCAGCDCVFHDESRNGRRVWCSMETCGNRAKVGRWRGRRSRVGVDALDACCTMRGECRCGAERTRLSTRRADTGVKI